MNWNKRDLQKGSSGHGFEVADDRMLQVLRAMTPGKRLETALYLARLARKMMLAQAKQAHPEWSNEQIEQHVAKRILRGTK